MPRTVPSFLAAISTSQIWSRPWWVALTFSLRSSIHLTGRDQIWDVEGSKDLLRVDADLRPKAATDLRGHHPDVALRDAQDDGQPDLDEMGNLGRRPHGELVGKRL